MNNWNKTWILLFINFSIVTQQWGQWQTILGALRAWPNTVHHRPLEGICHNALIKHPRARVDWPRDSPFLRSVCKNCSVWFHRPFNKTARFSFCQSCSRPPPIPPHPTFSLNGAWTPLLIMFIWTSTERTKARIPQLSLSAWPPPETVTNTTLKKYSVRWEINVWKQLLWSTPGRLSRRERKPLTPDLEGSPPGLPRGVASARPGGGSPVVEALW